MIKVLVHISEFLISRSYVPWWIQLTGSGFDPVSDADAQQKNVKTLDYTQVICIR